MYLYRQGSYMKCKICNKEISDKFYRHLNSSHKIKKSQYLDMFPDQREEYFSELLDSNIQIESWFASLCCINYCYNNKKRKYLPDFLINEKFLIELKSGYIYSMDAKKSEAKLKAGNKYCVDNNLIFNYWQFNDANMSRKKFSRDERVINFFESLK